MKILLGFEIVWSVCYVCWDFDWEVKLCGFEFWEVVIDYFIEFKINRDSVGIDKVKLFFGEVLVFNVSNDESL